MSDRPQTQAIRMLLVEDNEADVYLLRQALKAAGLVAELIVIADGAAAMSFVRDGAVPDMAVLDLNLPKHGGLDILEAIRDRSDWSKVPIAVMSSSMSPTEQARTAELGARRYIRKPPDLEPFLRIGQTLKEMLEESKQASNAFTHDFKCDAV